MRFGRWLFVILIICLPLVASASPQDLTTKVLRSSCAIINTKNPEHQLSAAFIVQTQPVLVVLTSRNFFLDSYTDDAVWVIGRKEWSHSIRVFPERLPPEITGQSLCVFSSVVDLTPEFEIEPLKTFKPVQKGDQVYTLQRYLDAGKPCLTSACVDAMLKGYAICEFKNIDRYSAGSPVVNQNGDVVGIMLGDVEVTTKSGRVLRRQAFDPIEIFKQTLTRINAEEQSK